MRRTALMRLAFASIVVTASIAASGCSTHTLHLKYEPTVEVVGNGDSNPTVAVGAIRDDRGEDSTWFGAIRGGYPQLMDAAKAHQVRALRAPDSQRRSAVTRGSRAALTL